jgi:hypothetical protein
MARTELSSEMKFMDSFGDTLTMLLRERGLSASGLGRVMNLDPAQVRRWVAGQRVPALKSDYVAKIGEVLGLDPERRQRLEQAQVDSLKIPKKGLGRPHTAESPRGIPRLLAPLEETVDTYSPPPPLPARDGPIVGGAAFKIAIALVDRALELGPDKTGGEILLTFQDERDPFEEIVPGARGEWWAVLQRAVREGFNVCHLWRLDRNAPRSAALVRQMLHLLDHKGVYGPRYWPRYGFLAAPYDVLVVPGVGAMTFYSTRQARNIDAAVLTRKETEVDVLHAHFQQLHSQTRPLLAAYSPDQDLAWDNTVTETEVQPGDRYLLKSGLSTLSHPSSTYKSDSSWWKRYAAIGTSAVPIVQHGQPTLTDVTVDAIARNRLRRLAAFRSQIETYHFRDLCPRRAVELLAEGRPGPDEYVSRVPQTTPPREMLREALDRLTSIVAMLDHPNYELGLFDDDQLRDENHQPIAGNFWEVKRDTVFIESSRTKSDESKLALNFAVSEPTIADGFRDYHAELWEKVAPSWRDQRQVVEFLRAHIAEVTTRLRSMGDLVVVPR